MPLRFPVRRFLQSTEKTQTPSRRLGSGQWVLSRPLYRFHRFDLAQVPAKNRNQALSLELVQWTPFAHSEYYVGWSEQQALVWAWDADKINPALAAQGLKRGSLSIVPETVLHPPLPDGLCLTRCQEGFEGQFWRNGLLSNSRWWPQTPSAEEWLMFQRDAGLAPEAQQSQLPAPRASQLLDRPWLNESGAQGGDALQIERFAMALAALALLVPTLWFGMGWAKVQSALDLLSAQKAQLQGQATPIAQARSDALDRASRIATLRSLAPYPEQLLLMAKVSQVLPRDTSSLKDWDFQNGQLKFTVSSPADVSSTALIGLLQQTGTFRDVKALPGRDAKSVTFQMQVTPTTGSST